MNALASTDRERPNIEEPLEEVSNLLRLTQAFM